MKRNILIIGAGIAGVHASQLLSSDKDNHVVLISGEGYLPYYRMRIAEVTSGLTPENLFIHSAEWYEENGIELIFDSAARIDSLQNRVILESGAVLLFDSLIIATGAYPFIPPYDGTHSRVTALRTMDDALRLRSFLCGSKSMGIIGGGVLGLEAASMAADSFRIPVHVIENSSYILSKQLDETSSNAVASYLEKKGIIIHQETRLKELAEGRIVTDKGSIAADTVLFSTGVRADKAIAESSGIAAGRGISVNEYLETDYDGIYAIGDAAEMNGKSFGLATYAREMAAAVSKTISGVRTAYVPSAPSSVIKIAGLSIASFGTFIGDRHSEASGDSLKTYFIDNGILRGAVIINDSSAIAAVKASIDKPFRI